MGAPPKPFHAGEITGQGQFHTKTGQFREVCIDLFYAVIHCHYAVAVYGVTSFQAGAGGVVNHAGYQLNSIILNSGFTTLHIQFPPC